MPPKQRGNQDELNATERKKNALVDWFRSRKSLQTMAVLEISVQNDWSAAKELRPGGKFKDLVKELIEEGRLKSKKCGAQTMVYLFPSTEVSTLVDRSMNESKLLDQSKQQIIQLEAELSTLLFQQQQQQQSIQDSHHVGVSVGNMNDQQGTTSASSTTNTINTTNTTNTINNSTHHSNSTHHDNNENNNNNNKNNNINNNNNNNNNPQLSFESQQQLLLDRLTTLRQRSLHLDESIQQYSDNDPDLIQELALRTFLSFHSVNIITRNIALLTRFFTRQFKNPRPPFSQATVRGIDDDDDYGDDDDGGGDMGQDRGYFDKESEHLNYFVENQTENDCNIVNNNNHNNNSYSMSDAMMVNGKKNTKMMMIGNGGDENYPKMKHDHSNPRTSTTTTTTTTTSTTTTTTTHLTHSNYIHKMGSLYDVSPEEFLNQFGIDLFSFEFLPIPHQLHIDISKFLLTTYHNDLSDEDVHFLRCLVGLEHGSGFGSTTDDNLTIDSHSNNNHNNNTNTNNNISNHTNSTINHPNQRINNNNNHDFNNNNVDNNTFQHSSSSSSFSPSSSPSPSSSSSSSASSTTTTNPPQPTSHPHPPQHQQKFKHGNIHKHSSSANPTSIHIPQTNQLNKCNQHNQHNQHNEPFTSIRSQQLPSNNPLTFTIATHNSTTPSRTSEQLSTTAETSSTITSSSTTETTSSSTTSTTPPQTDFKAIVKRRVLVRRKVVDSSAVVSSSVDNVSPSQQRDLNLTRQSNDGETPIVMVQNKTVAPVDNNLMNDD